MMRILFFFFHSYHSVLYVLLQFTPCICRTSIGDRLQCIFQPLPQHVINCHRPLSVVLHHPPTYNIDHGIRIQWKGGIGRSQWMQHSARRWWPPKYGRNWIMGINLNMTGIHFLGAAGESQSHPKKWIFYLIRSAAAASRWRRCGWCGWLLPINSFPLTDIRVASPRCYSNYATAGFDKVHSSGWMGCAVHAELV